MNKQTNSNNDDDSRSNKNLNNQYNGIVKRFPIPRRRNLVFSMGIVWIWIRYTVVIMIIPLSFETLRSLIIIDIAYCTLNHVTDLKFHYL